jgi:hypothetical protein
MDGEKSEGESAVIPNAKQRVDAPLQSVNGASHSSLRHRVFRAPHVAKRPQKDSERSASPPIGRRSGRLIHTRGGIILSSKDMNPLVKAAAGYSYYSSPRATSSESPLSEVHLQPPRDVRLGGDRVRRIR